MDSGAAGMGDPATQARSTLLTSHGETYATKSRATECYDIHVDGSMTFSCSAQPRTGE